MNTEIHDGSFSPMEIHITHNLSVRDIMKIRKDIEPGDPLLPGNGNGSGPSGTLM